MTMEKIHKMSGRCKYPDKACGNMTMLHGVTYCDNIPCSLHDEIPPITNEQKFKSLSTEFLVSVLNHLAYEGFCNNWNILNIDRDCDHNCKECIKQWLKQEASEEEWTANLE